MRTVAFFIWVLINLAFLGMGGYMYLILSSYWCVGGRREEKRLSQPTMHKKTKFHRENQVVFYTPEMVANLNSQEAITRPELRSRKLLRGVPRTVQRFKRKSSTSECKYRANCTETANEKLEKFKNKLFIQLRRVLHEESNVFKSDNPYFVNYYGLRERVQSLAPNDISCRLKKAGLRLLTNGDLSAGGFRIFNNSNEAFLNGKRYKTCAIVSSAGSLLNSKLGPLIDEHDMVLRFNHAPSEHYEEDVGAKTTVRLVNSQVVSKKEFHFIDNPLYKTVALVVWDPSNYTTTLQQWYEKPDFNFFENWAKQKVLNSKKDSFILDPRSIWKVWDFIQSLTSLRIRKNPPSSGFLGLALLLPYCDYVDFFEYVPSVRLTKRCHYYEDVEDDSCTFGVWHPLSAEKILSLAMNEANDTTVFETGFVRIKGYTTLNC